LTKLDPTGSALVFSTYLGAIDSDAVQEDDRAEMEGVAPALLTTPGVLQGSYAGHEAESGTGTSPQSEPAPQPEPIPHPDLVPHPEPGLGVSGDIPHVLPTDAYGASAVAANVDPSHAPAIVPNPVQKECIRIQKLYDWVVLTGSYRNKVPLHGECRERVDAAIRWSSWRSCCAPRSR